jgi:7,8-dihydroneopterin aldolase/epimerase/oxygenase
MDIIFLRDLRIETLIGIYDWERRIKQTVSLDLEMGADIRKAAASDHIDDTLNYKAVAKRLIEFVGSSEFQLVETLAERIAELVLSEFNVPWLRLTVNKTGAVRGARDVGIIIERSLKSVASFE